MGPRCFEHCYGCLLVCVEQFEAAAHLRSHVVQVRLPNPPPESAFRPGDGLFREAPFIIQPPLPLRRRQSDGRALAARDRFHQLLDESAHTRMEEGQEDGRGPGRERAKAETQYAVSLLWAELRQRFRPCPSTQQGRCSPSLFLREPRDKLRNTHRPATVA